MLHGHKYMQHVSQVDLSPWRRPPFGSRPIFPELESVLHGGSLDAAVVVEAPILAGAGSAEHERD